MQRWGIFLSAYSYDIEYKDTKLYANADSLSRLPVQGEEDQDTAATAMFNISFIEELPITQLRLKQMVFYHRCINLCWRGDH